MTVLARCTASCRSSYPSTSFHVSNRHLFEVGPRSDHILGFVVLDPHARPWTFGLGIVCVVQVPAPEQMLESLWDTESDEVFDEVSLASRGSPRVSIKRVAG